MKQQIITITGPSCSGKTTFQEKMITDYGFTNLVSTTTRSQREGEVHGENYYYTSMAAFEKMIENDELTQSVFFSGNHYGVTKDEIILKSQTKAPILTVVEPTGILQYQKFAKENDWDFKSIFIDVDLDIAIGRMLQRDKNMGSLEKRLDNLKNVEMTWRDLDYDIVIPFYNDTNSISACDDIAELLNFKLEVAMSI